MRLLFSFLLIVCCSLAPGHVRGQSASKPAPPAKRIAVTFDNLPAEPTYGAAERKQINQLILSALKQSNVPSAGFAVGDYIAQDWDLIIAWLDAGHIIGFHPYSGQRAGEVPVPYFFDDIIKGRNALENILETYEQSGRYFRLPFLFAGNSRSDREELYSLLRKERITLVDASVVTEDFVYNLSLEKMGNPQDTMKIHNLRLEYIGHIMSAVARSEEFAQKLLARQPRQILKLQANRINALFLHDILNALQEHGYKFISLKEALKDELYQTRDAFYDDNRQLSILERLLLSDPDLIPAEEE